MALTQREHTETDAGRFGGSNEDLSVSTLAPRPLDGLVLSPLLRQLIEETALDASTLSPDQIHQFTKVVVGITPPANLSAHRSVGSRCKRALDVLGAIVGLMITCAAFPAIALAIKLTSRGPVLFRQTRCGALGNPFVMWKFRTMTHRCRVSEVETESGYEGKSATDLRITKVGRILRSTSLDELPQFLNVLRAR